MSIAEKVRGKPSRRVLLATAGSLIAAPFLAACARQPATPDAQATKISAQETTIAQLRANAPTATRIPTPTLIPFFGPTPTKSEPRIAPTAAPARPTTRPAQEAKEKEPTASLGLIPTKISEERTSDFKAREFLDKNGKKDYLYKPEPGWKYVYTEFAVENKSSKTQLVGLSIDNLNRAILRTKDGFQYDRPVHYDVHGTPTAGVFDPTSTYFGFTRGGFPGINIFQSLPPGFRVQGVYNDATSPFTHPSSDDPEALFNRVCIRVGEQTSGYFLTIPPASPNMLRDLPTIEPGSFPQIDLTNGLVDVKSLKFPTDRPDSEFKDLGTTISIPGKGSLTIEKMPNEKFNEGKLVKFKVRFHNDSKGYGQVFKVTMKLFGNDGILYTKSESDALRASPDNQLYWDGVFVSSGEIPPGGDTFWVGKAEGSWSGKSNIYGPAFPVSPAFNGGKLMVSGDINEIFNVPP